MRVLRIFILPFAIFLLVACHSKKDTATTNTSLEAPASMMTKYATLMKVDERDLKNKKLIYFIDKWYGVPYKWGGGDKGGVDCSHLVCKAYQDVYQKKISGTTVDLEKASSHVKETKLKEGDLVFFKIESEKVSHVGIYVINNYFLHASVKKGVMLNSLDEKYYKKYFYSGGRIE